MSKTIASKKGTVKPQEIFYEKEFAIKQKPNIEITTNSSDGAASEELFLSAVKSIYWVEKHLVVALPKMLKAATAKALKAAIENHLKETKQQVVRLESVFALLGKKPEAKKCVAMEGLAMEGEKIIEETISGTGTRDVGIILASQKIEHYEIAAYGGLVQLATILQKKDSAEIFRQTLEEEKSADQKLTEVAENKINKQASKE